VKTTSLVVMILCLALFTACSGAGQSGNSNSSGSGGTVTPPAPSLTSLQVSPGSASVAPGSGQQFNATENFSDGSSHDVTNSVQWSSSNSSVASVSASGMATAVSSGVVTITAQSGSLQGIATVKVNAAAANLTSITVSPAGPSLPVHTSQQFTAIGAYNDGSSSDLTAQVSWSSSSAAVATIDVNGLASAVAAGSTTISASLGTISASTALTVQTPTISSISITPDDLTLGIGINQQYVATANYSDGSAQDLVSGVTWSSSSTSVATIDNAGVVTTVGAGQTTLTATVGGQSDTTTLYVVPANLISIAVSPGTPTIALGTTQQFTAVGTFDDGSTQLLSSVAWSSSASNSVSVDSSGMATAVGAGSATITATSGSVSGTASVSVSNATLVSVAVTPASSILGIGASKSFTATGTFSDSSTQDVTASAIWSSSNPAAATVNAQGVASGLATGTTTITATVGSVSGSTDLTVSLVHLVSIAISPSNPTIAKRTSIKLTAVGTFSDNSTSSNLSGLTWKASKPSVARMRGGDGVVYGKKGGSATITVTASGIKGTTTLTVGNGTLQSISITPTNPSVALGSTQQFTATGSFSDGSTQDVTINTHWSSSSASAATIANAPSVAGVATTHGTGSTVIGASCKARTANTTMTVN
jgi:trimeric autotransporter adhesin